MTQDHPDPTDAFRAAIAALGGSFEVLACDNRELWQLVLALIGRGEFIRSRVVLDAVARAARRLTDDAAQGLPTRCGHCDQGDVSSVEPATKIVLFLPRVLKPANVLVQACCRQCSELPRAVIARAAAAHIASLVPGSALEFDQ